MEENQKKLGYLVKGKEDKSVTLNGLSYFQKPFGEVEILKSKRGTKVNLKIKGLQQLDVSNQHGAVLCSNENKLKVYCNHFLSDEAEIVFENAITCLKINFDETLIAIGFDSINELHIFKLVPFVSSRLQSQPICKIQLIESFNQIIWNKSADNNLILRNTQSKQTQFVNFESKEVSVKLGQTDAVCFNQSGDIITLKRNYNLYSAYQYQGQDLDSPIEHDIDSVFAQPLSRIFYIDEYENNQWFIIGFNRSLVDDPSEEEDIDGMTTEIIALTGNIDNLQREGKNSTQSVLGDIKRMSEYSDFLEFKIVKISEGIYSLFQSVVGISQTFQIENKGQVLEEVDEMKVKNISGQLRGACFASFQIDKDDAFLQIVENHHLYYQYIPSCLFTFDSELTLQKYFICKDFSQSEEAKKQPNDNTKRTRILENQIKFEDMIILKTEEVDKKAQVDQQPNANNCQEQKLVEQRLENSEREQILQQNAEQPINKIEQQINNMQQEQQVPKEVIQEEIKTLEIQLTKEKVQQYLKTFQNYQQIAKKIIYSGQRYAYNHSSDTKIQQLYKYTDVQANFLRDHLQEDFHQPSIHSTDYIYEKDKLILCTNEPDGKSYIYAFLFEDYNEIHNIIKDAENQFNKIKQDNKIKPKDKIAQNKALIIETKQTLKDKMKKYIIFESTSQIIQIHVVFTNFLAIIFKNGVILNSLNSMLDPNNLNERNVPQRQFQFTIKQAIFSRSKRYILFLTTERQVVVMDTFTQQEYYRRDGVLFANFAHDQEDLIYILDSDSVQLHDFKQDKQLQKFNKFSDLNNYQVIHFEEYKPGSFYSIQYTVNVIDDNCTDCNNVGCQKCRGDNLFVFQSNNINSAKRISLKQNHSWYGQIYINENCQAKSHYNPQIKQLVTVFNQQGTLHILNIEENDSIHDPGFALPYWVLTKDFISGVIYFPYRLNGESDFFYYQQSGVQKITYLLPSIMIFSGLFHLTRVFLFDERDSINAEIDDPYLLSIISSKNTLITMNQYLLLINDKPETLIQHPDFYLIYEKMEQFSHIIQFLNDNNLNDIIEYQLAQDLNEIYQSPPQEIQVEEKVSEEVINNNQSIPELIDIVADSNPTQNKPNNKFSVQKVVGDVLKEQGDSLREQQSQNILKYKNDEFHKISQNVDIAQVRAYQSSLQNFLKPILDKLNETIKLIVNRIQIQAFDLKVNLVKYPQQANSFKQTIGINQIVNFNEKNTTIFAIQNQLFISNQAQKVESLQKMTNKSNIDLQPFSDIQFLCKFPQKGDNRIHLLAAFKAQTNLFGQPNSPNVFYHLVIEDKSSYFQIVRKLWQFTNKSVKHISIFEDQNEILVTYDDNTIELLTCYKQNSEATLIHTWNDSYFAIFSMIGTIFISSKEQLLEFCYIQLDSGGREVYERKSIKYEQIGKNKISKIIYMHQYNQESLLAIGVIENENDIYFQLIPIPVLTSTLQVIENQEKLNYNINVNTIQKNFIPQLQFKASYCHNMRQLYLTYNLSKLVHIFPMSVNNIVHKPEIQHNTLPVFGIQNVNGFYLLNSDQNSATYHVFDLMNGKVTEIKFEKNKESLLYNLDYD